VAQDVRAVTDGLLALGSLVVGALGGALGGYVFGVLRTLNERRNERRDAALEEIFKEMSLFYRGIVGWSHSPTPGSFSPEWGIAWKEYVNKQYPQFLRAFYSNAIWLGKDTYDLLEEFVQACRNVLNEFNSGMRADGRLADGTDPRDRWEEQIKPQFYAVQEKLVDEFETSRFIIPYRIVIRENRQQRTRAGA
jgi:hypothetical protein